MAARNQPQYDFLAGGDAPAAAHKQSLRASTIRADTSAEELRAALHKLEYEVQNLKTERDAAAVRHADELRAAQERADSDYKRAQAAESRANLAQNRMEALQRDVEEDKDNLAGEKKQLERKLRTSQEREQELQEEVDELQTKAASDARQMEYDLKELDTKYKSLLATSDELKLRRDEQDAALQVAQQQNFDQAAQLLQLQNEVVQLQTQGGGEDMATMQRQLAEQIHHIRELETRDVDQRIELKQLRERQKAIGVVEEEKRRLQTKLDGMETLRKELNESRLRTQVLEDERNLWSSYLEGINGESDGGDDKIDSPEDLAKAFMQERLERLSMVDQLGRLRPELAAKDEAIHSLESERATLREQISQASAQPSAAGAAAPDAKARARLERQRALAVKEVNLLREQLKAFDTEVAELESEAYNTANTSRIAELEKLIDEYRTEVSNLHATLTSAEEPQLSSLQPLASTGSKRARPDDTDERLGELTRRNRALQDESAELATAKRVLEQEMKALKSQLRGLQSETRTRVLELRSNPTADWQALRQSNLDALREENAALLAQAQGGRPKSVPQASFERLVLDLKAREADVEEKEKQLRRNREIWQGKAREFQEAVSSLLGWKVKFEPNGRLRLSSIFYPKPEGEDTVPYIVFDGEQGTMKPSGGQNSLFAKEIRGLVDFWVDGKGEVPCFLAASTLEFYDRFSQRTEVVQR